MKYLSLLVVIIIVGAFFRLYRTSEFLGFWYDQGRDAKIVWSAIHNQKLFLIGPTTGIEGIFLGPFYYYLLLPLYWFGKGDPQIPAMSFAVINVIVIFFLYKIGEIFKNKKTGLIAALLYGLSSDLVQLSRWLSNPTPLPLFAVICIYCLAKIITKQGSRKHWLISSLCVGLGLQLEAASATFFIPILVIIILIYRKYTVSSLVVFTLTLLPQFIFNIRHDNILLEAFQKFLITEKSFIPNTSSYISHRLSQYIDIFLGKISHDQYIQFAVGIILSVAIIVYRKKIINRVFLLLMVWWVLPMLVLLLYHGNHGFVWSYYFIGAFPGFILSIAWILASINRSIMSIFLALFILQNIASNISFITLKHPNYITFSDIYQAVEWIYKDNKNNDFNVDIYVPPVMTDAYDYFFLWLGTTKYSRLPSSQMKNRLYLIAEPDGEHPYYRQKWLNRQNTYGQIELTDTIGPLYIARLSRYDFSKSHE